MKESLRIKKVYSRRRDKKNLQYSLFFSNRRGWEISEAAKNNTKAPLIDKKILDVGCGNGDVLSYFSNDNVPPDNLYGIDIQFERIEKAQTSYPHRRFTCGNAGELPYTDGYFDIVTQSTMFTSVLDNALKKKMAFEMLRVLHHNGIIIWHDYKYSNPLNPDVKGIGKREIMDLFPDCQLNFIVINLNPFIARPLVKISWTMCELLEKISFLRTHLLVTIKKA